MVVNKTRVTSIVIYSDIGARSTSNEPQVIVSSWYVTQESSGVNVILLSPQNEKPSIVPSCTLTVSSITKVCIAKPSAAYALISASSKSKKLVSVHGSLSSIVKVCSNVIVYAVTIN